MIAKYLWIAGSLPFIILGLIHLWYTFFTSKFSSRNNALNEEMKTSFMRLTKATTIWKAWIGLMPVTVPALFTLGLPIYF